MNALARFFDSQFASAMTGALLHTLWQGLVIGLILYAALRTIPAAQSRRRYRLGIAALLAVVVCWLGTFSILRYEPQRPGIDVSRVGSPAAPAPAAPRPSTAPDHTRAAATEPVPERAPVEAKQPEPAVTSEAAVQKAARPAPPDERVDLHPWLMGAWLIGVVVMTGRLFSAMAGAAKLKRCAEDITDPALLELLAELCREMRIRRPVRLAACRALAHPGVVGFFTPLLLVPVSILSEVPAADLRVILAHELAHIRRMDYLVNFGQMVVEAVLFFNPAVWWISRQIRVEREACCDQAGVAAAGRPVQYAQVLCEHLARAAGLHRANRTAALAGFAGEEDMMADRVARIVRPGHKPRMRIGSIKLALCLLIAAGALLGLGKAADLTVEVAARILTPAERVERLQEIAKDYSAEGGTYTEEDKFTLAGTISTHDGAPLPKYPSVYIMAYGGRSSHSVHFDIREDGSFQHTVPARPNVFLGVEAEGYAPFYTEEYHPEPNEVIDDLRIVLTEGFVGRLQVIDPQDRPIAGAEVLKQYFYRTDGGWGSYGHSDTITTDAAGMAEFPFSIERPVKVNVRADGYQPADSVELTLRPGVIEAIQLEPGLRASGLVVDPATGEPIAGAVLRLAYKERPGHGWHYGTDSGKIEATSDAEGRFTLSTLAEQFTYSYVVEAEGYNRAPLVGVREGAHDLVVEMGPVREIRGRIVGDLSKLGTSYFSEFGEARPVIRYNSRFNHRSTEVEYQGMSENEAVAVEIAYGVGTFTIRNILGDQLTIQPQGTGKSVNVRIGEETIQEVTIDLDATSPVANRPTREVVLTFQPPPGYPAVEGKVKVWYMTDEVEQSDHRAWSGLEMEVVDGVGRVDFPADAYLRLADTQDIRGFWIEPDPWDRRPGNFVAAAEEPYRRTITAEPAGSIYGQILGADGELHKYAELKLLIVERSERYKDIQHFHPIASRMQFAYPGATSETGRFHTRSLALGGTYAVAAMDQQTWMVSEPIALTDDEPMREVTLQAGELKAVSGRVLLPDGSPAQGAEVTLDIGVRFSDEPEGRYSTNVTEPVLDGSGTFAFDRLNTQEPLRYKVNIKPPVGYQPHYEQVEPGRDYTIRLQRGYTLRGRLIDAETGWPIPDAQVSAEALTSIGDFQRVRSSDGVTDEDGRFVFTSLNDERYRLFVPGLDFDSLAAREVVGGQDDPVELRGTLQSWSGLKPRRPDGL